MTIPGGSLLARFSFLAIGPIVNPCAQTVINTNANVNVMRSSASWYPSSISTPTKYPATVRATIPLGAIQLAKVFSCMVNSVFIVASHMESGRTINNITNTKLIIGHVNTSAIVSRVNDAVSKTKTVDVKITEIFSTTWLISPMEETYLFVRPSVKPSIVTASIPVSCMTTSDKVKQMSTKERMSGDFKYSGKSPLLAILAIRIPSTKPRITATNDPIKKFNK